MWPTRVQNLKSQAVAVAEIFQGVYAGIRRTPTFGFFLQRILTSVIINKQGIRKYML